MRERAITMAKTVVDDINDPFNVVVLNTDTLSDDPARLSDEANAISMMGGKRLIRIENATDKVTSALKDYLDNPNDETVIICEAGELPPRSSLRKLAESKKNAAAVPCYIEDERDIARLIRETIQTEKKTINNDAVQWLASNITGDRGKARAELEKVLLYKGTDNSPITLSEVQNICGQAGAQGLDDLVYAIGGNNPASAMRAYQTLLDEGVNEVAIIRTIQTHFRKLHKTKALVEEGENLEKAMKTLMPPIFFKQQDAFRAQIRNWPLGALSKILEKLNEMEAQTKTSNMPIETLCAQGILAIAAQRARR